MTKIMAKDIAFLSNLIFLKMFSMQTVNITEIYIKEIFYVYLMHILIKHKSCK